MASANHGAVLRDIDRIFNQGSVTGLAEGQLLRQFATRGDDSAFEALVTRHGPMVLGVCRWLLHDPRDVEDAFQATFLVLARHVLKGKSRAGRRSRGHTRNGSNPTWQLRPGDATIEESVYRELIGRDRPDCRSGLTSIMVPSRARLRIVPLHDPAANVDRDEPPTTLTERLEMMWPLALDAWAFKGEPVVEPRLPRHIVRIHRRES